MRVLILMICLLTPGLVQAQSVAEARTFTATPFANVTFGTSGNRTSSLGLGAAVGYDFTPNLGLEGELGYVFDVQGDSDTVDWSLTNVHANVVYHFDVIRVTPYATAGLGRERSHVQLDGVEPTDVDPALKSSTEVTFNFGGGLKYEIADNLLARADLRRFQANDTAPDHWRLYGGLTFVITRRNP
jgi:opacity protein-like surface antigen